ncbi:MAG: outer membrane protein [Spirosomataceae bacterium]|jgi:outer membrane protein
MKKLLSNFTYVLLLAACPIFISAQEMTLEECVSTGIKNHPDFQTQLLAAEGAEADVRIAKSQQMPRLNVEVYQSTSVGRSIDRFTNAYIDQLYNSTFANASFSVPIYQGFQLKHNIRQNELLREAATTGIESARNQLTIRIAQNYLSVLASQELVKAAERQVGLSQTQADRVTKQIEAGTVGRPVLLQLQTQVANDEFALISAQNNVEIARLLLFQSMNRRPDNSVDFTPLEKEVVLTNFDRSEFTTSINQLPEIKSQEIRIKSFDSQLRSVKSDNLPSLDAFANYGSFFASSNPEENFFEQLNGTRNGSVTIGLTIPIFASFRTRPRAQAVSVQKKVAENQLVSNKLQLTQAFEQALQSYKNAVKRYQNVQKQVDINQENLNAVTSQVDAGTVNVVELLLARTNFDRAQNNFIQTKYELLLQRMLLDFYRTGAFNF